ADPEIPPDGEILVSVPVEIAGDDRVTSRLAGKVDIEIVTVRRPMVQEYRQRSLVGGSQVAGRVPEEDSIRQSILVPAQHGRAARPHRQSPGGTGLEGAVHLLQKGRLPSIVVDLNIHSPVPVDIDEGGGGRLVQIAVRPGAQSDGRVEVSDALAQEN